MIAKKFYKGKGKFKGKLPSVCFNFNEVGHIAARFLETKNYKGGDKYITRRDEDNKDYKDNDNKSCYIVEEETKDGSDDHDDEVVCVAMKDDSDEDKVTTLVSYVNKSEMDH